MPTYLFEDCDTKERVEIFLRHDEYAARVFECEDKLGQYIVHDKRVLKRLYVPFGSPASSVWPKKSLAAGVNPDQIAEQEAYDRDHGVPTKYDKQTGDAIYTSMNHQRKHLKLHGLVERDSFL